MFMDKNAIKTFAVESRRKMIKSVKFQASLLGITADGIKEPISKAEGMETYDYGAGQHTIYDEDIKKRQSLVREINNKGFENVVEEVAYTWFNRIIAIRYMEINDYLPTYTRVLSSEIEGKIEPDIITEALELDLDYSEEDREKIFKLKEGSKLDVLFQFLFIKQCNKLNDILPGLFEKTDDYMELLLDIKFTDENGIIRQLINTISEEDFGEQVEIIGWLYQYYNSELKDETFKNIKKNKVSKERIPAATQLFTPDWIVKYMVENSVGRLWIEGHSNDELKDNWKYYLDEPKQESDADLKLDEIRKNSKNLKPQDIKIIDPSMGSGHILVYVFDVLMQIYVSEGYTEKDASEYILKYNLYGLDIDDRAYQLSYFALMMKARSYNRTIFKENINPLLHSIKESDNISSELIDFLVLKYPSIKNDLNYIVNKFNNAKLYGSILKVNCNKLNKIKDSLIKLINNTKDLKIIYYKKELLLLLDIINQADILSKEYDIVITNPPYMGIRGINVELSNFLKKDFPNSKSDLSTVFMERGFSFLKKYGYLAMINIPVWMFISAYEKLRKDIVNEHTIINMIHLGRGIFGSDFGTTSFIINNAHFNNYISLFKQLYEDKGAVDSIAKKEEFFFRKDNVFQINQNNFSKVPGCPIAYWVPNNISDTFKIGISIEEISEYTGSQNKTANNNKYIRYFWEVSNKNIGESNKWIFYAKGGSFKKYYGNNDLIVDWSEDARNFYMNNNTSNLLDKKFWFKEGITYTAISSKGPSFRYLPPVGVFDMMGPSICYLNQNLYYVLGFLNSELAKYYLNILNPTIAVQAKDIKSLPIIINNKYKDELDKLVIENVEILKIDYDNFETSFEFQVHPLLNISNYLSESYNLIKEQQSNLLNILFLNETKINELFLEIYNLTDFNYNIDKNDFGLDSFELDQTIKSFISYAVGCMFGRYSLDEEGLQFAGGEFNINNYSKFIPDDDNIIPVLDTEYFNDDIVGRFVEFVKVCFGEETLEENLDFIAGALKKKGKTSREIIRNYFLTDFFKDHAQTYKKTPIYWQFDSGKQNAFKCLIYMHRYEPGLVARVRTDYLHKTQKAIEQNLAQCESIIANSSNKSEVSKATKDKSKYIKQLDEIKVYDEALAHIANQRIEIDLDDGVKVNHAKFQNVEISKEGQKAKKINLLKKI